MKIYIARCSPLELSRSQVKVVGAAFVLVNYLINASGVFNLQIF